MDDREFFRAVLGLFDDGRLKRVENDAGGSRAGRALHVVLVRLPVDLHPEHDVRRLGKRRFNVLGDGDDGDFLLLADVHDGEELLRRTAPGQEDHDVPLLEETGRAVDGFCRGNETGRLLDAAKKMGIMLADDAGMAAAAGADPGRADQKIHGFRISLLVEDLFHFTETFDFDIVSIFSCRNRVLIHGYSPL